MATNAFTVGLSTALLAGTYALYKRKENKERQRLAA
jgi:hypothetical protein